MTKRALRVVSVAAAAALCAVVAPAGAMAQSAASDTARTGFVAPAPVVRVGPPAGWEFAFSDGRLNPNRARRTDRGDAQSSQLWTDTVPRRAIPLPSGVLTSLQNMAR